MRVVVQYHHKVSTQSFGKFGQGTLYIPLLPTLAYRLISWPASNCINTLIYHLLSTLSYLPSLIYHLLSTLVHRLISP